MTLPPFLARLIGDRSSIAPDLTSAQGLGAAGGRFPSGLVTNVLQNNPYRPNTIRRDFPTVAIGWHPGTPPRLRPGGLAQILPTGLLGRHNPADNVGPIRITHLPQVIPGGRK